MMGQSKPSKPQVLEARDIPSIAKYIKSTKCRDIFFMVGAGISTSAGIPDFRSPNTGLYANLAKLRLPYPEAVFDIQYFEENPQPFYTLAAELYPGYYRPTVTHSFLRLLAEKKKLHTAFTQNIDTLERVAGVPIEHIFEAHGSFATQRCIRCGSEYPDEEMKKHVLDARVPYCKRKRCGGLVKPDIVFFGEGLPDRFPDAIEGLQYADLLIIMGTSLTVYPFAGLRSMVPASCPRVLINLDKVGDIGSRSDDVFLQMACDEAVRKICEEIGDGWPEELERLWKETETSYTPRDKDAKSVLGPEEAEKVSRPGKLPKQSAFEDDVARMAKLFEEKAKLDDKASPETAAGKLNDDTAESDKSESTGGPVEATHLLEATTAEAKISGASRLGKAAAKAMPTPHYEKDFPLAPEAKPVGQPEADRAPPGA